MLSTVNDAVMKPLFSLASNLRMGSLFLTLTVTVTLYDLIMGEYCRVKSD